MPDGTERRASSDPSKPPADSDAPPPATPERSGPLAVARHRKADGRLLILYTRVAEDG